MELKKHADKAMPKHDNKCNGIQNESILPKYMHENLSNEGSVIVPESGVKILSRGDLLGAINCIFPELNLKRSRIKLKENFSLFSYSPQELTRIFESGRKYRSRIMKSAENSIGDHSIQMESNRINFNSNSIGNSSKENVVLISNSWKKAQSKQNEFQMNSMKREESVQFQSTYMDFLTKYLEAYFPDRLHDFKNIECLIQALNDLYKQISKTYTFAPFNPNLPVLNISQCVKVQHRNSNSTMEKLTKPTTACTKNIRNKKTSSTLQTLQTLKTKSQNEGRKNDKKKSRKTCKRFKNRKVIEKSTKKSVNETKESLINDLEDEIGRQIAQNLEDILNDDTFSPRYKSKYACIPNVGSFSKI